MDRPRVPTTCSISIDVKHVRALTKPYVIGHGAGKTRA